MQAILPFFRGMHSLSLPPLLSLGCLCLGPESGGSNPASPTALGTRTIGAADQYAIASEKARNTDPSCCGNDSVGLRMVATTVSCHSSTAFLCDSFARHFLASFRICRVLLVGQCYKLEADVLRPEELALRFHIIPPWLQRLMGSLIIQIRMAETAAFVYALLKGIYNGEC